MESNVVNLDVMGALGLANLAEYAATRVVVDDVPNDRWPCPVLGPHAWRGIVAQFNVRIEKDLITENMGGGEMVAPDAKPHIVRDDVVVNDRLSLMLHVSPSKVALCNRFILIPVDDVAPNTRASIISHIAVHNDRAGAPHIEGMGMAWRTPLSN